MKPMDIEKESFAIIEKELTTDIPAEYKPVVKRVIHTCLLYTSPSPRDRG